jgi:hypothetical protein
MNHQHELVDEPATQQGVDQLAAPHDVEVPARLRLEVGDRVGGFAVQQGRVRPRQGLAKRPRRNEFASRVQRLGKWTVGLRVPVAQQVLVCPSPEDEPAALEGRYTDGYLAEAGGDAPKFTDEELETIASPLDFVGINLLARLVRRAVRRAAGYRDIPINASHPKMQSSWHVLDPEVMYWAPRQVQPLWGAKSIFITENGCGASDVVAAEGRVYDSDRVMFLRACLGPLQRATAEGVPVDGYFLWSAQDNFEWMDGFGNRYGLIYVDFETQQRIPKLSAEWVREAARQNAVV